MCSGQTKSAGQAGCRKWEQRIVWFMYCSWQASCLPSMAMPVVTQKVVGYVLALHQNTHGWSRHSFMLFEREGGKCREQTTPEIYSHGKGTEFDKCEKCPCPVNLSQNAETFRRASKSVWLFRLWHFSFTRRKLKACVIRERGRIIWFLCLLLTHPQFEKLPILKSE